MIALAKPDLTQREIDAVVEVMQSGVLSIGPRLGRFEELCAEVAGRRFGIGVNSGTSGLHITLLAAGVKPGDQIVTTPFSFIASANCILMVGARPVFVDIDPKTLNADPAKVEAAVNEHTRGIVAVEAFGHPGGMAEQEAVARKNELVFIEDCCEGFGGYIELAGNRRKIGSFGRAGVFGFYPNKQITTGEGGMIVTDDDKLAEMCRSLRNQGRDTAMAGGGAGNWLAHVRLGYNYRLTELAAAIGIVQIERLADILASRRRVADAYTRRLLGCSDLILPNRSAEEGGSWFVYVVRLSDEFNADDRDALINRLRRRGVGCANYFPPIHLQPFYRERFGFAPGDFPMCESISARTLALPFHAGLEDSDIRHVCDVLETELAKVKSGRG